MQWHRAVYSLKKRKKREERRVGDGLEIFPTPRSLRRK